MITRRTDEFGTPDIPEGHLLSAIGPGISPVDSLAEYIRAPMVLASQHSGGLNNESFYIWIKRKNGKLVGAMIPKYLRERFDGLARDEAARRDLPAEWFRALPKGAQSLQRSGYWRQVAGNHLAQLASDEHRREEKVLEQKFELAEKEFNRTYEQYQRIAAELDRQQQMSRTLQIISTLLGVMHAGLRAEQISSAFDNKVAADAGTPEEDLPERIKLTQKRITATEGVYKQQRITIDMQAKDLQTMDQMLREIFKNDNVPIPKADEQPIIIP
jgi:hypothetical protein